MLKLSKLTIDSNWIFYNPDILLHQDCEDSYSFVLPLQASEKSWKKIGQIHIYIYICIWENILKLFKETMRSPCTILLLYISEYEQEKKKDY